MDFYLHHQGQQLGPYPLETVHQMLRQGGLSATDLVWHEGAPEWMPLPAFLARNPSGTAALAPAAPIQPVPPRNPALSQNSDAFARRLTGVHGVAGLTPENLQLELQRGGKFIFYQYCISIVVMTFKRSSGVYFIRGGESTIKPGLGFTILSLVLGWWGIPWGPIWTVSTVVTNCAGGKDVTPKVMAALNQGR